MKTHQLVLCVITATVVVLGCPGVTCGGNDHRDGLHGTGTVEGDAGFVVRYARVEPYSDTWWVTLSSYPYDQCWGTAPYGQKPFPTVSLIFERPSAASDGGSATDLFTDNILYLIESRDAPWSASSRGVDVDGGATAHLTDGGLEGSFDFEFLSTSFIAGRVTGTFNAPFCPPY